jgi:hypothetical protein
MNQLDRFDVPFSTSVYGTENNNQSSILIKSNGTTWNLEKYVCELVNMNFANAVPTFSQQESFTLRIPTSSGITDVSCIIPADSTFLITDINNLIKFYSIENNFYLINNDTLENEYFVKVSFNPTSFKVEFVFENVPTSLPSGFTAPVGMTFPVANSWAQLVLPSTSTQLLACLGFNAGSYPSTTVSGGVDTSFLGARFPQEQKDDNFLVMLDCVRNEMTEFSNYLAIVNVDVPPGQNILYRPSYPTPVRVGGTYSTLKLSITDVNGIPVKQLNGNWSGTLRFTKIA